MIYLNNAATSWPKPETVYWAVDHYTRNGSAAYGRGHDSRSKQSAEVVFECRCAIAELMGIPQPERVVFTQNATDSINIALKGLLRKGDHLIISDMEHNSVLRPALKLQAAGTIEVSIAMSDAAGVVQPAAIERLIRPNTALVEVVHVSNVTGSRNDITAIGALCDSAGIPLMVDAAQSAGSVDIDVTRDGIDILAAPGHKGLLGPQGTGILYVAPTLELDTLREGGNGGDTFSVEQPHRLPDRFESGTLNLPGIAGLLEGVRFVNGRGSAAIGQYKASLVNTLSNGLSELEGYAQYSPANGGATVLAFSVGHCDSVDLCEFLADNDIATRGGFHCSMSVHNKFGTSETGMVRISPGVFSTAGDIEVCIESVRCYVQRARRCLGASHVANVR